MNEMQAKQYLVKYPRILDDINYIARICGTKFKFMNILWAPMVTP